MSVKISPSALATYRLCPRKWGWRRLNGIKAPQHPSASKGEAVHKHLEDWLRDGKAIPNTETGRLAMKLLDTLPPPGVGVVEDKIEFEFEGVTYHGKIDLTWENEDRLTIRDHKTTSDLKWAKDECACPEECPSHADEQAVIYSQHAFEEFGLDEIDFEWGYVTTRGKIRPKVVRLRVVREENENRLRELNETALEMVDAVERGLDAEDLDANALACDAFGGCYYRNEHCKLTSTERMKSIMASGSLKERLAKRKAEKEKQSDEKPAAKEESKPKKKTRTNKPKVSKPAASSGASKKEDKGVNSPESKEKTSSAPSGTSGGLTVRDQFALSALNGLLANTAIGANMASGDADKVSAKAYELADAMLAAR